MCICDELWGVFTGRSDRYGLMDGNECRPLLASLSSLYDYILPHNLILKAGNYPDKTMEVLTDSKT